MMLQLNEIVGYTQDPELASRIHDLSHQDKVENIFLSQSDVKRKRIRIATDKGTDCAISLARNLQLATGAVLLLENDRAVVVIVHETKWLTLRPRSLAAAIELGYFAGNMHWKVRFDQENLQIALESPEKMYLDRLREFISENKITKI